MRTLDSIPDWEKVQDSLRAWEGYFWIPDMQGYWGLLRNHPGAADFFYDRPYAEVTIRTNYENDWGIIFSISSIDDGSIVLMAPSESQDDKSRRLIRIYEEIDRAGNWGGWIPTEAQVEEFAKSTGMYWNR